MYLLARRKSSSGGLSTARLAIILGLLLFPIRGWGLEPINVSYGSIGTSQSLFSIIAQAEIFKKHGLDASLIFIAGHGIKPLLARDVQFAVSGGPPAVQAILAGARIKILAASPGEKYAIMGSRDVKTPSELRGGRFGISQFGTTSDVIARLVLKQLGLKPLQDVMLVQIGSQGARLAGLRSGSIQAAAMAVGWEEKLKSEGLNVLIARFQPFFPASAVSVEESYLKSRPEIVLGFTRSVVEGIVFYKQRAKEAKGYLGRFLKLKTEDPALEKLYTEAITVWEEFPFLTPDSLQNLLEIMAERNPKAAQLKFDEVAEMKILQQVKEEGFLEKIKGQYGLGVGR